MKIIYIVFCSSSVTDWIVAIIAILGLGLAWCQLRGLNNAKTADFTHRLKKDFFNDKTQLIIFYIDIDSLCFKEFENNKDYSCFILDKEKIKNLPDEFKTQKEYAKKIDYVITTLNMDDLVLGHFEDLGLFKKKKVIRIEFIYESFDWYIQLVHENCAIQRYLQWQRKQENCEDIYDKFDYIAEACKNFGLKKNKE